MPDFIRYEDVPVVIGAANGDKEFIFASHASLSISQNLQPKRFLDDCVLPFAETGDISFLYDGHVKELLMGAPGGPAIPLSSSVEEVKSGTMITFPTGNKLYVESGIRSGDYYIHVKATGATDLSFDTDLQNGEIEVERNYCTTEPIGGTLNIAFFLNTGTLPSFFNLTGLLGGDLLNHKYPRINEEKITGFFGNYFFHDGYLESLRFSTRAFYPYMAEVSIRLFGNLTYDENNIDNFYVSPEFNSQKTIPHAVGTELSGLGSLGIDKAVSFDYSINCQRSYGFEMPATGKSVTSSNFENLTGVVPTRGAKNAIEIEASIEGNRINPYLSISGTRGHINISVQDMGFVNYPDENFGKLKEFNIYGPITKQSLSVGEGDYLKGNVTIKDVYR
jgi:hypothetical protein